MQIVWLILNLAAFLFCLWMTLYFIHKKQAFLATLGTLGMLANGVATIDNILMIFLIR